MSTKLRSWLGHFSFQFLGIPPKGELQAFCTSAKNLFSFQFLGIPPKGERLAVGCCRTAIVVSNF